jgi:hypothetical protein
MIFWPLKFGILLLFYLSLIATVSVYTSLAGWCGNGIATGIVILGVVLLLFAYTYSRDTFQGVQVEQIENGRFAYEYSVANWCLQEFRDDFARHRLEDPENA